MTYRPFSACRAACLALLVAAAVPSGSAAATTFSRDPATNAATLGWIKVGNSIAQGNWVSGPHTASFDVYSAQFVLSASDTVSAPAPGTGTASGDSYLYGPLDDPAGSQNWKVGDNIVALGVKWVGNQ